MREEVICTKVERIEWNRKVRGVEDKGGGHV